jgi:molybdopterin molybdotransferase
MLTIDQAIEAILERTHPLPARSTVLIDALGLILDEEIVADTDLPPFDKATMDGYAVRSADLPDLAEYNLRVVEEIAAGQVPTRPLLPGEASRIMTGAPLPSGADAVVMVERSKVEGSTVTLAGPVAPGLNRLIRGREMKVGEVLLSKGTRLDASMLGLIASAGRAQILAIPRPSVSVLPTGDELVPVDQKPGPGQIRNSNGVILAGLARAWGVSGIRENPVAGDDPELLRASLAEAMNSTDVLIVSGGVSAGSKDLVPSTLVDLGVERVFHKVNVKPGKPLWFGVGPSRGARPVILVFGLPGNPVSGVVSFLLFVRPALEALAGWSTKRTQLASFFLGRSFEHRGDRPTYHPARFEEGRIIPLDWGGSADLRTVALADGFAAFPAGDRTFDVGEEVPFLPK